MAKFKLDLSRLPPRVELPKRPKIKLELRPPEKYVEPPPLECAICNQMRPDHWFGAKEYRDPHPLICMDCEYRLVKRVRITVPGSMRDETFMFRAQVALKALQEEIRNAKARGYAC